MYLHTRTFRLYGVAIRFGIGVQFRSSSVSTDEVKVFIGSVACSLSRKPKPQNPCKLSRSRHVVKVCK